MGRPPHIRRLLTPLWQAEDPAIPRAILGVKKEYLDAAFDEMQTKYGTIERYFSSWSSFSQRC
jgi:protein tyrosine/serine phosphatase